MTLIELEEVVCEPNDGKEDTAPYADTGCLAYAVGDCEIDRNGMNALGA